MTELTAYLFWTGLTVVFYTYVGYGIVIFIMSKFRKRSDLVDTEEQDLPEVTFLIAAYNEEDFIAEKIKNTLSLDYPAAKLSTLVVTDGSTDSTPELVKKFRAVRLLHEPKRNGKIHAVNRAMKHVQSPVVIFSDANAILNSQAIKNIVRHYQDKSVGGVAGEKRIVKKTNDNASGSGEGIYWKYESFLKRKDAEVHSIVGAAGELFSIRTELYEPPSDDVVIEDFYLSLRITMKGYRFAYEPDAYAVETASVSVEEEWKRKVRICAGGFQAMSKLAPLLNPFRYGILSFQYISHRVLRWTFAPVSLLIVLLSNLWLAATSEPFYITLLGAQIVFYLVAILGYILRDKEIRIKGFFVPYYFAVMNLSVYAGFIRYKRRQQSVVWEKARRASMNPAG